MKTFLTTLLSLFLIGGLYAQDEPVNDTVYMTWKGKYIELTVAFVQGAETEVYIATGDGACTYIAKGNDTAHWSHYYNYEGEYQIKLFATSGDLKSRLFGLAFRGNVGFTSLDASGCTALQRLKFATRSLNSLDVSGCSSLTHLYCRADVLDISGCTSLTHLHCGGLTSLDVRDCISLDTLICRNGDLTSLDVSHNTALVSLDCGSNQLTSLDVSQNTALEDLNCYNNQLTSLDVSQNMALEDVNCYNNQLTSLDVSRNTALASLDCSGNQLQTLDVSRNTALESLDCGSNQLTSLDLSMNTSLHSLSCNGNGRAVVLDELGRFDLSTLTGFEVNRAKDWTDGVLSGNMLEFQQGIVSYVYSTNNPNQAFVKFALGDYSPVAMPNIVAIPMGDKKAEIALSTTTPDATIFYTTDGREPTELSQQYEIPIEVKSSPVTIKAITVKDGKKSRVATATFSFPWLPNEPAVAASTLRVYAQDGTIYLSEPVGEVDVITTSGRRVYRGVSTAIPVPRPGVYVVTAAGRKYKVGVK